MTDQTHTPPIGDVARGSAFALLTIPAAIAAFAIIGGVFQFITGFVAIIVPYIAAWLYQKGAGAPLTRSGWAPFILISAVATILGLFTGLATAAYSAFLAVGGNGGPFGSPFLRTLVTQLTRGFDDNVIPILFGLGLGAVAIVSVLRGPRTPANRASTAVAPAAPAPAVPAPQPTPPASTTSPSAPVANQPSPGIMLNGKPLDPNKK